MVTLATPPDTFPVTLEEAKQHLRILGDDEDGYIKALLGAATEVAQSITGRQLEPATYDLHLNTFPRGAIEIPRPPLVSVESISYIDPNGEEQEVTGFEADTVNGTVGPSYNSYWPATRATPNAVRVRFVAGYPTGETPFSIRCAILLLVAGLYENRESETPEKMHTNEAVGRLLWPHRVF